MFNHHRFQRMCGAALSVTLLLSMGGPPTRAQTSPDDRGAEIVAPTAVSSTLTTSAEFGAQAKQAAREVLPQVSQPYSTG